MNNLVIIESPFAGDVERNLRYLRAAMSDCFSRGEAPFASHGLYTQPGVLDDDKPAERELGIAAGLAWGAKADTTVVYTDLGISKGMQYGIEAASRAGRLILFRTLPPCDALGCGDFGGRSYEHPDPARGRYNLCCTHAKRTDVLDLKPLGKKAIR